MAETLQTEREIGRGRARGEGGGQRRTERERYHADVTDRKRLTSFLFYDTCGFVGLGINAFTGLCVNYFCVPC